MSNASLTNLRMVRPKGPKIFLAIVLLALLATAAWYFTRPSGPIGAPEDPARLLVVGTDPDIAATLTELGFKAEHAEFAPLVAEAREELAAPPADDLAAILRLADSRGYGYLALEDPATHPLGDLTVTATSATITPAHPWAVFAVGDLGTPPHITVDPKEPALPLPGYIAVIRAAFEQERLAGILFPRHQLPINAVTLHDQIDAAMNLNGAYNALSRKVRARQRKRLEILVDAEKATPKPTSLANPLEWTQALALADGTVLSLVHRSALENPRDLEVSYRPRPDLELWYQPSGSTDLAARKRCTSLRGGTLTTRNRGHVLAPAADALLLETTHALELWTLDTTQAACAFTRRGVIPQTQADENTWGVPHVSGRVLRPARADATLAINVWTAGEQQPQSVPLPGCTRVGDPVWLDEEHVAVSCRYEPPTALELDELDDETAADDELPPEAPPPKQAWIYVVRLGDRHIVALPSAPLGPYEGVYRLVAVPNPDALELVAYHPWSAELKRVQVSATPQALFTANEQTFRAIADGTAPAPWPRPGSPPPEDEDQGEPAPAAPPEADAPPDGHPAAAVREGTPPLLRPTSVPADAMVAAIAPDRLKVTPHVLDLKMQGLAVSADGKWLVFGGGDGRDSYGHTLKVVELDSGKQYTIADNPSADHGAARFSADGRAVVFTSYYNGPEGREHIGQQVASPGAAPPAG